jgi:hypothetical protein
VFKVLPEWPEKSLQHIHKISYDAACEKSKANAIRIDNTELLIEYDGNIIDPCFEAKKCLHDTGVVCKISTVSSCPKVYRDVFAKFNGNRLKHGDIFQVEGFEYEVNIDYIPISRGFSYKKEGSDQIKQCDLVKDGIGYYDNGKVAILKLAKEESKYCECNFAMIMRDQKTQIPYCSQCKKEVQEFAKEEEPKEQEFDEQDQRRFKNQERRDKIIYNHAIDKVLEIANKIWEDDENIGFRNRIEKLKK